MEEAFSGFCGGQPDMDAKGFVKLCKRSRLVDDTFTSQEARLVFGSAVHLTQVRMDFESFICALRQVASRKNMEESLVYRLVAWSYCPTPTNAANAPLPDNSEARAGRTTEATVRREGRIKRAVSVPALGGAGWEECRDAGPESPGRLSRGGKLSSGFGGERPLCSPGRQDIRRRPDEAPEYDATSGSRRGMGGCGLVNIPIDSPAWSGLFKKFARNPGENLDDLESSVEASTSASDASGTWGTSALSTPCGGGGRPTTPSTARPTTASTTGRPATPSTGRPSTASRSVCGVSKEASGAPAAPYEY